ncbi:hypothetical protein O4H62_05150 [Hoeflea alexandrii]|nr:hypothetical protein [Hoeflea alexandrii]
MIATRRIVSRTGLVRMLCALSLLLVAFAHKPLVSSSAASGYPGVDIAEFVLPDGTLPDLCLTGEENGAHHSLANHCEACRIVSSVDLPSPFDGYVVIRLSAAAELAVPQDVRFTRPFLRANASPRGPPRVTA